MLYEVITDGNTVDHRDTASGFNWTRPGVITLARLEEESDAIAAWVITSTNEDTASNEISVFVRLRIPAKLNTDSGQREHPFS